MQVLAAQHILEGQDVVLAAETGSGKTIAYLGPILSSLLARKQQHLSRYGQTRQTKRQKRFIEFFCVLLRMQGYQSMHSANCSAHALDCSDLGYFPQEARKHS